VKSLVVWEVEEGRVVGWVEVGGFCSELGASDVSSNCREVWRGGWIGREMKEAGFVGVERPEELRRWAEMEGAAAVRTA